MQVLQDVLPHGEVEAVGPATFAGPRIAITQPMCWWLLVEAEGLAANETRAAAREVAAAVVVAGMVAAVAAAMMAQVEAVALKLAEVLLD